MKTTRGLVNMGWAIYASTDSGQVDGRGLPGEMMNFTGRRERFWSQCPSIWSLSHVDRLKLILRLDASLHH